MSLIVYTNLESQHFTTGRVPIWRGKELCEAEATKDVVEIGSTSFTATYPGNLISRLSA